MKNYKNQIMCASHKQPIIKIDTISKKLYCPKCELETPDEKKKRIEVTRAKLNSLYMEELNKLKGHKLDIDKLADTFLNHNMVEAKRKIKKQLPAIQQTVNEFINKEVQDANRILKLYIDKQLKAWSSVDGKKFDLNYLQFEKSYPQIIEQIESKKQELKGQIAMKLKAQMRVVFIKIFNF